MTNYLFTAPDIEIISLFYSPWCWDNLPILQSLICLVLRTMRWERRGWTFRGRRRRVNRKTPECSSTWSIRNQASIQMEMILCAKYIEAVVNIHCLSHKASKLEWSGLVHIKHILSKLLLWGCPPLTLSVSLVSACARVVFTWQSL